MFKLPYEIEGPYTRPKRLTTFQKIWVTFVVSLFAAIAVMALFN